MRKKLMAIPLTLFVLAALVVPLSMSIGSAQAHVHGITPLLKLGCVVDNTVTGAKQTAPRRALRTEGRLPV